MHWVGDNIIQRPSLWMRDPETREVASTKANWEGAALTGATRNYSYMMVGDEMVAVRRHSCWCNACFNCNGRVRNPARNTAAHTRTTATTTCHVAGGESGELDRVELNMSSETIKRRTRNYKYKAGVSLANSKSCPLRRGVVASLV
mmetsp:Transcript_22045/g.68950  ORF Transcript_22045/g.68950 Transcript_22045/m.68950 type:complete len:146 (-) Transcript_22045:730-1167(-)